MCKSLRMDEMSVDALKRKCICNVNYTMYINKVYRTYEYGTLYFPGQQDQFRMLEIA